MMKLAAASLAAGDRIAALDHLLAAWRSVRAPAIADLIDVVSDDVARVVPALPLCRTLRERQDHWLEICAHGRAIDVPRLLVQLAPKDGTAPAVEERLVALERHHPADPRIGRALMTMLCGGFRWNPRPMWTVAFRMLSAIRDTRGRPMALEERGRDHTRGGRRDPEFYDRFYLALDRILDQLATPTAPVDAAELAAIASRARAFAAGPPPELFDTEPHSVNPV
jgi:hypothetical protein